MESPRKLFKHIHVLRTPPAKVWHSWAGVFWKTSPGDTGIYSFGVLLTHAIQLAINYGQLIYFCPVVNQIVKALLLRSFRGN